MQLVPVQLDLPAGGISATQSSAAELASTVHVNGDTAAALAPPAKSAHVADQSECSWPCLQVHTSGRPSGLGSPAQVPFLAAACSELHHVQLGPALALLPCAAGGQPAASLSGQGLTASCLTWQRQAEAALAAPGDQGPCTALHSPPAAVWAAGSSSAPPMRTESLAEHEGVAALHQAGSGIMRTMSVQELLQIFEAQQVGEGMLLVCPAGGLKQQCGLKIQPCCVELSSWMAKSPLLLPLPLPLPAAMQACLELSK